MAADRGPASPGRALEALALSAAIALAYLAYWSLWPTLAAGVIGNDALFLADGARRIAAGQFPHRDFALPTGVLPYLTYALAERWLAGLPPYIGSHLVGFVLLVPLLVAAASRLRSLAASFVLVALVAMAALLPFNTLAGSPYAVSFHASYNRLGAALSLVYLAWLFRAQPPRAWRDGLVLAYAALFAGALKIVYVGVVLGPVAVLVLLDRRWRAPAFVAALAMAGVLAVVQAATGLVTAYGADLARMASVNAGRAVYFIASFVFKTLLLLGLLGALVAAVLADALRLCRQGHRAGDWKAPLVVLAPPLAMLAAIGALIVAESQATSGLGLLGALGLLFAPGIVGAPPGRLRPAAAIALASVIGANLAVTDLQAAMSIWLGRTGPTSKVAFVERYLPHTVVPETLLRKGEATAALWTASAETMRALEVAGHELVDRSDADLYIAQWKTVDDALVQLGRSGAGDLGAVVTLANVDLFGLALRAKPAKGVALVHDVGRTIRPLTSGEAAAYLAGADTVFEPTCSLVEAPGAERLSPWFDRALTASFRPQVLTPCWSMHRRVTPPRQPTLEREAPATEGSS